MAENKCAARLEPSSRDMSELKNRFKPGYDWGNYMLYNARTSYVRSCYI